MRERRQETVFSLSPVTGHTYNRTVRRRLEECFVAVRMENILQSLRRQTPSRELSGEIKFPQGHNKDGTKSKNFLNEQISEVINK